MTVQPIYKKVFPYFRGKRLDRFAHCFKLSSATTILDVGGGPIYWQYRTIPAQITILNQYDIPSNAMPGYHYVRGDGTNLEYPDNSFDIAHSNSVIEHVSTWDRQVAFAREIRRVGHGVWVQTPAKCFPVECHTLDPFFHSFPKHWRRRLLRRGTLWGWLNRPTMAEIDEFLDTTRLLTFDEMQELFPDCTIITERFAGFPKSYIAYRAIPSPSSRKVSRENSAAPLIAAR
ncbi:MAG: class I SAM-dependent methyltransferase [Limisphaerales bacterium]